MSLPSEKYNALITTYNFLRELLDPKKIKGVPKSVRKQAYWCLRHWPFPHELSILASKCPEILKNEVRDYSEIMITLYDEAELEKSQKRLKTKKKSNKLSHK